MFTVLKLEYLEKQTVQPFHTNGVFRGNRAEEKILSDYLASKGQTCVDLFQDFLREFVDKGNFKYKINRSIMHNVIGGKIYA